MHPRIHKAISFIQSKYELEFLPHIVFSRGLSECDQGEITPNAEIIKINNNFCLDVQIRAIYHEICHFLQIKHGDLVPSQKIFKSKSYSFTPYWFQPHEREARRFAEENWVEFNEFMRKRLQF